MRLKDLEEIEALFQTWPHSFLERFGRKITLNELLDTIKIKKSELELLAINTLFAGFNIHDLDLCLEHLERFENEHILDEDEKPNLFKQLTTKKIR